VAPFIVIVLLDWILYGATIFFMRQSGKLNIEMKKYLQHYIIVVAILSVLFVATWIFGLLGTASELSRNAYVISQYLFSVLAAIHSILTFIMHTLIATEAKQFWMRMFYTMTGRRQQYAPKQPEVTSTELSAPSSGKKEVENIYTEDPGDVVNTENEIVEDVEVKVNLGREDQDLDENSSL